MQFGRGLRPYRCLHCALLIYMNISLDVNVPQNIGSPTNSNTPILKRSYNLLILSQLTLNIVYPAAMCPHSRIDSIFTDTKSMGWIRRTSISLYSHACLAI